MEKPLLKNRVEGGLVGMLVGDSLGVPYEFNPSRAIPIPALIEMAPPLGFNRTYPDIPIGTWSDDGAQALCLLESLLECGEFDLEDFSARLLRWLDQGHLTPDGFAFDCGIQTRDSLARLRGGTPPSLCGGSGGRDNGNGSLMRVLPLALWHRGDDYQLVFDAQRQSLVTHAHPRSLVCCALYCLWARQMLMHGHRDGWDEAIARLRSIYQHATDCAVPISDFSAELDLVLEYGRSHSPSGSGYVVDTLWSARWALLEHEDFESVVRAAIGLGGDTDTTACVAGGLAGVRGGVGAIPDRWLSTLRGEALYKPLGERLSARMADLSRKITLSHG